jgi:hypothetical protein
MSGKLRSGIATYYRILGAPLRPQAPFDIELRFEGADADDAVVELRGGDGAQFSPAQATHRWRLIKNQPALVKLKMTAPLGDSYLHVLTVQHGRQAVRSFVLHVTSDGSQPR